MNRSIQVRRPSLSEARQTLRMVKSKWICLTEAEDPIYTSEKEMDAAVRKRFPELGKPQGTIANNLRYPISNSQNDYLEMGVLYGKGKDDRIFRVWRGPKGKVKDLPSIDELIKYIDTWLL